MATKSKKHTWKYLLGGILIFILAAVILGTYYMTGPVLSCALPAEGAIEAGWSMRRITSDSSERCYVLYAPSDYDPSQPIPLVVSLHGFLSNPHSQGIISDWHSLAEDEGFLVVYPQGTRFPQRWDSGMTWGVSGVDDVQFFMDILDDVSSNAAVDPSRVYVNGFSNGGGMTVYLGCEASQVIAAMGTVAGAVVENKDCDVSHPIPVMAFHGTGDPVVPYQGGEMEYRLLRWGANITDAPIYFIGAPDWTARWAQLNGCAPDPEEISAQGDVSGIRYTDCLDDAEVVFYTIEGGGHTWPGGMPLVITGKTSNDIDATEELWRFFQKYQLEQ